jgi:hypothetical protein
MRQLLTDAHVRLLRAVRNAITSDQWLQPWMQMAADGPALVVEDFASEPWASLTFCGMRHRLDIRLSGTQQDVETAYDRLKAILETPEFDLPGHFLAELELIESKGEIHADERMSLTLQLEALTIEE